MPRQAYRIRVTVPPIVPAPEPADRARAIERVLRETPTRLVVFESPTNPVTKIADIAHIGFDYDEATLMSTTWALGIGAGIYALREGVIKNQPLSDTERKHLAIRNWSAVTAACMMMRREVFTAVGGGCCCCAPRRPHRRVRSMGRNMQVLIRLRMFGTSSEQFEHVRYQLYDSIQGFDRPLG